MAKTAKIVVGAVMLAVSGFFIYSKIAGWHTSELENAVQQVQEVSQSKTDKLEEEIISLERELANVKGQTIPEEKLAEVFGADEKSTDKESLAGVLRDENKLSGLLAEEEKVAVNQGLNQKKISTGEAQQDVVEIERRISAFFSYLDDQPYVQSYGFAGGSYLEYQIAIKKLSSELPIITGEMQSLYSMVRNVAHFYRVMGKKRIFVTRQILQTESEIIESVMKTFYLWFTTKSAGQATIEGRPSPEMMYNYAGYLLNTLGGRSYLLRRNPKIRALTTYYCVLTLDRANDEELNSKGIDIRPYIKTSFLEVKNQIGLIYQKEYMAKLSELNLKYHP